MKQASKETTKKEIKATTKIVLCLIIFIGAVAILCGYLILRQQRIKKYAEEHSDEALLKKREAQLAEGEWLITQFSDAGGEQANVYTLSTTDKLIIIDGGWIGNADNLRKIIATHDNHVNAWIISHPHRDHAGAFNTIYSDLQGITIDTIYDNDYDYAFIESVGEPYDDITILENFYALTANAENLVHLKRGDETNICGLTFHIYNAFDDIVKANVGDEGDYQNNASLCMKITNKNESFLYTADIKTNMNNYLYSTYGSMLNATYVQLSHHGNWGIEAEYYDQMQASVYFLDAPSTISDSPDFPASALKKHLLEQGKTVYDFTDAPHSVILK